MALSPSGKSFPCPLGNGEPSVLVYRVRLPEVVEREGDEELRGSGFHADLVFRADAGPFSIRQAEILDIADIPAFRAEVVQLGVEHGPQQLVGVHVQVVTAFHTGTYRCVYKVEKSPAVGHVHVHLAGGRPYPVLFRLPRDKVLHAGEVDSPRGVLPRIGEVEGQCLEGDGHLHSPRAVCVIFFVERSVQSYGQLQAFTIPRDEEGAFAAVGLVEHEVEHNAPGIVLYLEVLHGITVRIQENLEVVVVVDNRIALRQVRHDVVLGQCGGNVEAVVVPYHLYGSLLHRGGVSLSADIDKGF